MGNRARSILRVFQFYLEIDVRGYVSRLSPSRLIQFASKIELADALIDWYH
jgi:hypothetical protein